MFSGADFALARYNADGTLDGTFGTAGKVTTTFAVNSEDAALALALQADGKIVLAGNALGTSTLGVARYLTTGALDTTFGTGGLKTDATQGRGVALALQTDGKVLVATSGSQVVRLSAVGALDTTFAGDGSASVVSPVGLAVQGDGKVVAAMQSSSDGVHVRMTMQRLTTAGVLDTTFGVSGTMNFPFVGQQDDWGRVTAVQPDGKILLAGFTYTAGITRKIVLARVDEGGVLDGSFGTGGKVEQDFVFGSSVDASTILLQPDGNIVLGGTVSSGQDFALARFTSAGVLDATFDTDGKVTTAFGASNDSINAMALQGDGKIVVFGQTLTSGHAEVAVARYTTAGALDTTFDSDGKVTTVLTSSSSLNGESLADGVVLADGKLLGVGRVTLSNNSDFLLVRYTATGALDTTFGTGGIVRTAFTATSNDLGQGVVVQADGKYLVGGYSQDGGVYSMALARYLPTGALDATFGTGGKSVASVGTTSLVVRSVQGQADGKLVLVGSQNNGTNNDMLVVRFNADGALDETFGVGGVRTVTFGTGNETAYGLTVQADGKLLVSGEAFGGDDYDFGVVRLLPSGSPIPVTLTATSVGVTTATLQGTVNADSANTTVSFEYGTTPALGTTVAGAPGSVTGSTPSAVSAALTGLAAHTTYYFRVSGENVHSTEVGATLDFTTLNSNPTAPAGSAVATTGDSVTFTLPFPTTDVDGDAVTLGSVTPGAHLTVNSTTATTVTFTADANYAGGSTLDYTVQDAFGGMASGTITVTIVDNDAPTVVPPASVTAEATSSAGAVVTFAPATANDAVGVTSVTYSQASGSLFPIGMTTVTVTAADAANNTGTANFTVEVVDTTAPVILPPVAGFTPLTLTVGAGGTVALPDFTTQAVTSDAVGVTSVTQTPPAGSMESVGTTHVTLTAHDAAGNMAVTSFGVSVVSNGPVSEARYITGMPVPGAGLNPDIIAGAKWLTFKVPAINEAGQVAFKGKWSALGGKGTGIGIFVDDVLVARTTGAVPGLGGVVFKDFRDPVIDAAGDVAFVAIISGTGVTTANDTVLVTTASGALAVVAREGDSTPEADGAALKSFTSISLVGGEVLFTAKLLGGTPAVIAANDDAAFRVSAGGGLARVVRESDAFGATTVRGFKLLTRIAGSSCQNRGHAVGSATFHASLADGTQAIMDSTGGVLDALVMTNDLTGGTTLPLAQFTQFGMPATDSGRLAVRATMKSGVGGVTGTTSTAVFVGTSSALEPVARVGQFTGLGATTFRSFLDPVLEPGTESVAFTATLKGTTAADDVALWWKPEGQPLALLARKGDQPAGILTAGAKWRVFTSVALPGGGNGPLFMATMLRGVGGVDPTNDMGVWGVDSTGALRLLFRKGDTLAGKTVKRFASLSAVLGSPGVTRSFNSSGQVAWQAEFTDSHAAIIVTQVP